MAKNSKELPEDDNLESSPITRPYVPSSVTDDTSLNEFNSTTDVEYNTAPKGDQEALDSLDSDDFELLAELGRGGMGVVNKCRQKSLDRVVAVKSILSSSFPDEKQLGRFLDEARAVAKLKHENIVAIHQVSKSTSDPFFVMEFVDGKPLDELIRTWTLDQNRAVRIMLQISRAIQEAHHNRIVHRDLKPANVLVDNKDRVRVTDFGLAKFLGEDDSKTIDGQILGTPSFMAPEQAKGTIGLIDERTDIYAIGATLYACLTGAAPFRADGITETLQMVQSADPVPPRRINPRIGRDIETICLKCMEKEPNKRYQSTEELIAEFERVLNNEPIQARPISSINRLFRVVRKKPLQSSLLISTAVLLLVVLTVVPVLAFANQNQRIQFAEEARLTGLENELALSISNGAWKSGLLIVDELLLQAPDDPELVFQKLRCWNALGHVELVEDEIKRIYESDPQLIESTPLLLWKGDTQLLGRKKKEGIQALQQVLQIEQLSPADKAYAQALLSDNPDEVARLLRDAIHHDPAHHRAMTYLFSTLLLSGELAAAETQVNLSLAKFPQDPNLWAMKLIAQVAQGNNSEVEDLKNKVVELGGEPMRQILDDLISEYSSWATLMDTWESSGADVAFKKFQEYAKKLATFKQEDNPASDEWLFDKSFLRMPLGWQRKQQALQSSLRLVFFAQYKMAADQMSAKVDEQTNGDTLFMIGQAYTLAGENIRAAEFFEQASQRRSRFINLGREANWCAAMNYATVWLQDKSKMEYIEKSTEFARRHLDYPPAHVWHEVTLGKIACNTKDFETAKKYLERIKKFSPEAKELPDFENRVYSVAHGPIDSRIKQLAGAKQKPKKELIKEIDAYQELMIQNIRQEIDSVKSSLE